jgi:hypothetical protein
MLRLILLVLLVVFLLIGGVAVALYHFWGWKGLIAFPFVLLIGAWLAKVVVSTLFKRFALGLFGLKSGVLRGATMTVHSVRSIPKPVERENQLESGGAGDADGNAGGAELPAETEPAGPESPKDYVEVDVTITPKGESGNSVWEPSELMLTAEKVKSLADLEDQEVGTTHSVEVWDGTAFGPDDPGKYPGPQRLKIVFETKPGTTQAWLHYYNEPIGPLTLPPGTIEV